MSGKRFAVLRDQMISPFARDASVPRDEREFAYLVLERGEQLLRHPGGAEKPAALRTVFDF